MSRQSVFAVAALLFTSMLAGAAEPDAPASAPVKLPPAATNAPTGPKTISLQEMLVIGPSGLKLHSLAMITQGKVQDGVDESFLPGLKVCAEDPATPVRSITARLLGEHFVAGKDTPNAEAIQLLMTLAKDSSSDVSHSAVYHGLSQLKNKSNKVIELMIDVAAKNREPGLFDQIAQSLENDQEKTTQILNEKLHGEDSITFYEIYEKLTGKKPSDTAKFLEMPSSRPRIFIFKGEGSDPEAFKAALETELIQAGLQSPSLYISGVGDNYVLMLKTYITKDYLVVEEQFENHSRFVITQDMWLTPQLEIQIDSMRQAQP